MCRRTDGVTRTQTGGEQTASELVRQTGTRTDGWLDAQMEWKEMDEGNLSVSAQAVALLGVATLAVCAALYPTG